MIPITYHLAPGQWPGVLAPTIMAYPWQMRQDNDPIARAIVAACFVRGTMVGVQSIPLLMLLLALASNPLLWFFAIMKLAQNYHRFSLRALLIAMTVAAALLGIGSYAVRMIAQS